MRKLVQKGRRLTGGKRLTVPYLPSKHADEIHHRVVAPPAMQPGLMLPQPESLQLNSEQRRVLIIENVASSHGADQLAKFCKRRHDDVRRINEAGILQGRLAADEVKFLQIDARPLVHLETSLHEAIAPALLKANGEMVQHISAENRLALRSDQQAAFSRRDLWHGDAIAVAVIDNLLSGRYGVRHEKLQANYIIAVASDALAAQLCDALSLAHVFTLASGREKASDFIEAAKGRAPNLIYHPQAFGNHPSRLENELSTAKTDRIKAVARTKYDLAGYLRDLVGENKKIKKIPSPGAVPLRPNGRGGVVHAPACV